MHSKHFIDNPAALVDGMCKAVIAQTPGLRYDQENKVVFRVRHTTLDSPRVTLISGGGSGHEPAHAGYVGRGMLDAAVCGQVFASPNVGQILQGLQRIKNPAGVLVIVKNYTGDKLNFGLAAEEFRAKTGTPVKMVMVEDDVAVPRSRGIEVGRRGLAGTIFVHKTAGAASERGYHLDQVAKIAQQVAQNLATIGVSLDHCSVPGASEVASLANNEIELGMGIHNEPGVKTLSPQPDINTLVDSMLVHLLDKSDKDRAFVDFGSDLANAKVALLVNNLGGLSTLELTAISSVVLDRLASQYKIRPLRFYTGTLLTSLDGPGFSVTLLNIAGSADGISTSDILSLLDDDTDISAWPRSVRKGDSEGISTNDAVESGLEELQTTPAVTIPGDIAHFTQILEKIQESVKAQEPALTKYDTLMGDGDCGTTLLAGADAVYEQMKKSPPSDFATAILETSVVARNAMGGTSGALYGLFLGSFASSLQEEYRSSNSLQASTFANAASSALENLQTFTSARVGSRTLMDALIPFVNTFKEGSLEKAVSAAKSGAEETKNMKSSFGRSVYVGAGGDGSKGEDPTKGIPDPGALGVVAVLEGILAGLNK